MLNCKDIWKKSSSYWGIWVPPFVCKWLKCQETRSWRRRSWWGKCSEVYILWQDWSYREQLLCKAECAPEWDDWASYVYYWHLHYTASTSRLRVSNAHSWLITTVSQLHRSGQLQRPEVHSNQRTASASPLPVSSPVGHSVGAGYIIMLRYGHDRWPLNVRFWTSSCFCRVLI